jgi:hypothetical protein
MFAGTPTRERLGLGTLVTMGVAGLVVASAQRNRRLPDGHQPKLDFAAFTVNIDDQVTGRTKRIANG